MPTPSLPCPLPMAILAVFTVLAVTILTICLGIIGSGLRDELALVQTKVLALKSRVVDLEAENDLLFEERPDYLAGAAQDLVRLLVSRN